MTQALVKDIAGSSAAFAVCNYLFNRGKLSERLIGTEAPNLPSSLAIGAAQTLILEAINRGTAYLIQPETKLSKHQVYVFQLFAMSLSMYVISQVANRVLGTNISKQYVGLLIGMNILEEILKLTLSS